MHIPTEVISEFQSLVHFLHSSNILESGKQPGFKDLVRLGTDKEARHRLTTFIEFSRKSGLSYSQIAEIPKVLGKDEHMMDVLKHMMK